MATYDVNSLEQLLRYVGIRTRAMVRKHTLTRIARWLRKNREQLSRLPLSEVKNRMVKEVSTPSKRISCANRGQR